MSLTKTTLKVHINPYINVYRLSMAREPLLLILAFFTFFALAIIYVRLDFAITKDEGTEVRLKVAGYCEKVSGHQVSKHTSRTNEQFK